MSGKMKGLILLVMLISVIQLYSEYQYEPKQILVLHSYSPSMVWVDEINSGINSVINSEHNMEIQVTYEFLDAKRFNNDLYFLHTAEALKFKYENTSFQAIISCDDHAIDFLKKYRDSCFPGIPIFFCGVNNLLEEDFNEYPDIKGIFEANPIDKNIALIKKLLPDCEVILAVADSNTKTNQIYQQRINRELEGSLQGIKLKISENETYNDLEEELASLPDNTAVLYFSYIVDANGEYLPHIPAARRLLRRCNRPVFTINRIYLSLNVVGGYVTDPYAHGASAAMMTADYLRGISLDDIFSRDYISDKLFPPVFNLKQLDLYSINLRNLPENAIIFDMEEFTRQKHKREIKYLLTTLLLVSVVLIYMLYINIQNRKIKQNLLEKENLWAGLTENLPVIIFRMDPNGNYSYINSQVTRFLGIERERIIGHTARESGFCEAICLANEQVISDPFPGQKSFLYDIKVENPLSNEDIQCEIHYQREMENGQIKDILGYINDNTENQILFQNLTTSLDRYKYIFENSNIGYTVLKIIMNEDGVTADFRLLLNNSTFREIFQLEEDPENKLVSNILPDLELGWSERLENVVTSGVSADFIASLPELNKWIKVTAFKISAYQLAALFYDITEYIMEANELKLNNTRLINNNEDLQHLIDKKTVELQEKDDLLINQSQLATLGDILSTISSQWYKSLNDLDLFISDQIHTRQSADTIEKISNPQIEQAGRVIHSISTTIEEFSYLFLQKKDKADYDISVLVRKVVKFIDEIFGMDGINIEMNLQEGCSFFGYAHEYAQVILNLLNNSREAIKISDVIAGKISISLNKDRTNSFLRINDNAGGIPPEYNEKIFTPFFTTKMHPIGAGLGLYISRKIIIEKLGGSIFINNVDDGAEFTIETPLCVK